MNRNYLANEDGSNKRGSTSVRRLDAIHASIVRRRLPFPSSLRQIKETTRSL